MEPLNSKPIYDEAKIQKKFIEFLTLRGWYCLHTHGNAYQSGFPDIFACSKRFGARWVEIKKPVGGRLTKHQLNVFTNFSSKNIGVWIATGAIDWEYNKLFGPANWHTFLNSSGGIKLDREVKRIPKSGPEAIIQNAIITRLTTICPCKNPLCSIHTDNNWFCIETFGSMYQFGFPDIYCCHKKYGARWIECKNPLSYRFTPAQIDTFPRLSAEGIGVWIITSVEEVLKIFGPPNWYTYL